MIINDTSLTFSLQHTSSPSSLLDLIDDCYRFVLGFFEVIEESSMHIYHSALPWSPTSSPIRRLYQRHIRTEVKLINAVDTYWDACIRRIPIHDSINAMTFSHTGSALAVGSKRDVKIFETATGAATFEVDNNYVSRILGIAFSPDDNMLACGFQDGSIRVWDVQTSNLVQSFEGHEKGVPSVAFSSCGTMVVSGSRDKTARIWNMSSDRCKCVLEGHLDWVVAVCWCGTDRVISGSEDASVRVWDVSSQTCLMILHGHAKGVTSVASSYDSCLIASGSSDETVKVYDPRGGDVLQTISANLIVESVQFSADSDNLLYATLNHSATIWNLSKKEKVSAVNYDGFPAVFSPDWTRVASEFGRCHLKISNPESGSYLNPKTVGHHAHDVESITFAPDGSVMASRSWREVKIWDTSSGDCLFTFDSDGLILLSIVFSPNSAFVASQSRSGILRSVGGSDAETQIWNVNTRRRVQVLRSDVKMFSGNFALSPCGGRLVSQSSSQLILWGSKRGNFKRLAVLDFDSSLWAESQIAFAVDGTSVFIHSGNDIIQRWSIPPADVPNNHLGSFFNSNLFASPPVIFIPMQEKKSTLTSHLIVPVPPRQPECFRYSGDEWILDSRGNRMLWLPSDQRGEAQASKTCGKKIAVGTESRRIYVADFSDVLLSG
jgi:WD40 repeat protein